LHKCCQDASAHASITCSDVPRRWSCWDRDRQARRRWLWSFVTETLIAAAPDGTEAHYYRTATGTEADLVLTLPGGKLWAVEIKRSSAPTVEGGFHIACADLKPSRRFVVYSGNERFPLNADTDAIGLSDLGRALQAAA